MAITNISLSLLGSESASSPPSVQVFPPGCHLFYRMCLSSGKSARVVAEGSSPSPKEIPSFSTWGEIECEFTTAANSQF